jgi:hypothetical protein
MTKILLMSRKTPTPIQSSSSCSGRSPLLREKDEVWHCHACTQDLLYVSGCEMGDNNWFQHIVNGPIAVEVAANGDQVQLAIVTEPHP